MFTKYSPNLVLNVVVIVFLPFQNILICVGVDFDMNKSIKWFR